MSTMVLWLSTAIDRHFAVDASLSVRKIGGTSPSGGLRNKCVASFLASQSRNEDQLRLYLANACVCASGDRFGPSLDNEYPRSL